ncbi:MAG: anthranilate synthase component I, partial [Actinomycetota bacterium]|nr:anthranilate synthase component I [Actinomycetota bacterium]
MTFTPDRDAFVALAARHSVVPVWREVLVDTQTPVAAFLRVAPGDNAFLLESVEGGERWARYSFLGGDAFATITARGGRLTIEGDVAVHPEEREPPLTYV